MPPHRSMTGLGNQMSLTQQRGAATLQTENEDDVRVHGETKQSVSTPVSRRVLCVITVSVHGQSYCGEKKKNARAICLSLYLQSPLLPLHLRCSPRLHAFSLQHLCLPVLRQQFPFPSSLLFPLPFFPSHWLGPLIVSGTCPQEP